MCTFKSELKKKKKEKTAPKRFLIFQRMKAVLIFQEMKTPKKFNIFSQKKAFLIFQETETLKKILIFQETKHSYTQETEP